MTDVSYSAGALAADGPSLRGVRFAAETSDDPVFRGVRFAAESVNTVFRGLRFASEGPRESHYYGSAWGSGPINSPYSASALAQLISDNSYDGSANLLSTEDLEYQGSASLLSTEELEYQSSTILQALVSLSYDASGFCATSNPPTDVTYSGDALAFQQSFRGFRFAPESVLDLPVFRGLRFTQEELSNPSFRGVRFSTESLEAGSSFRGLRFGYEPPAEEFYYASAYAIERKVLTYQASAVGKKTMDASYQSSALGVNFASQAYSASAIGKATLGQLYQASAVAKKTIETTYTASVIGQSTQSASYQSSALVRATVNQNYQSSVQLLATTNQSYSASMVALQLVEKSYSASTIAQKTFDLQTSASAIAAERATLLRAHSDFSFANTVPTTTFVPVQGSSSGETANNPNTLFAWIQDVAGTERLYGRLDTPEFEPGDPAAVPATEISTETGMQGVKVAHFGVSNRWAVVWKRDSDLKYRIFDSTLTPVTGDIAIIPTLPVSTYPLSAAGPDHFDIGTTDEERLVVVYTNMIDIIDVDAPATVSKIAWNAGDISANKIAVHPISGNIDNLYISSNDLFVDRFDSVGDLVSNVSVATAQAGLDPLLTDIINKIGDDRFIAVWVAEDELRYRLFDASGSPQTPVRSVPGTGGLSATGRSLSATVGESGSDPHFSFAVKVTSDELSYIAWIRPDLDEQVIYLSAAQSSPTPINGVNEFQFRHIYSNGGEIAHEVYVNSSVYMGLWKIERDNRSFIDATSNPDPHLNRDGDAASLIEGVWSGYAGGNRLSGSSGASSGDYTGAPGRSSVDLDTDTFDDFLGTVDEDTLFTGGPIHSQVASSMQLNSNMFAAQIQKLSSEMGISSVEFTGIDQGLDGLQYGADAPGIQVVNEQGTFLLRRHLSLGGDDVDYAIILRLATGLESTQEDTPQNKSFWYAAGITTFSTEAAANAVAFPVEHRLGQSSALLVIVTYPSGTTNYVPGITPGTISVVPLSDVDSDDFEA